jgi:hypothetical protein
MALSPLQVFFFACHVLQKFEQKLHTCVAPDLCTMHIQQHPFINECIMYRLGWSKILSTQVLVVGLHEEQIFLELPLGKSYVCDKRKHFTCDTSQSLCIHVTNEPQ